MKLKMYYYYPIYDCGNGFGDTPACWDKTTFSSKEDCEAWIEAQKKAGKFTDKELAIGIWAYRNEKVVEL